MPRPETIAGQDTFSPELCELEESRRRFDLRGARSRAEQGGRGGRRGDHFGGRRGPPVLGPESGLDLRRNRAREPVERVSSRRSGNRYRKGEDQWIRSEQRGSSLNRSGTLPW